MRMDLFCHPTASPAKALVLVLAAGGALLPVSAVEPGSAGEPQIAPNDATTSLAQGVGGLSMPQQRVYIDPATGKLIPRPATPDQPQAVTGPGPITTVPPELSTSAKGLQVVPNPKTGGGVMVDLQGRFQQRTTATLDAEGTPILHRAPAPVPDGTKEADEKEGGN